MKKITHCILLTAVLTVAAHAEKVGIPSSTMNMVYAEQHKPNWCWAASIQMVMNFYKVKVSQEKVVARSFGTDSNGLLIDKAGDWATITANLDGWGIDQGGATYAVTCKLKTGNIIPFSIWASLDEGRPVIVGYNTGGAVGHAVVVTAMEFQGSFQNGTPHIISYTVRDPWPGAGMKTYAASEFGPKIHSAWIVSARKED